MMNFGEAPLAYGLTRGMARTIGVNLVAAVTEGWLTRPELNSLVSACAQCGQSTQCTHWLAETVDAPTLPGFCVNKAEIESLRA